MSSQSASTVFASIAVVFNKSFQRCMTCRDSKGRSFRATGVAWDRGKFVQLGQSGLCVVMGDSSF